MKERRDIALHFAIRLLKTITDKRLVTLQDRENTQAIECGLPDGRNGEKRAVIVTPNGLEVIKDGEIIKTFPFESRIADFPQVCRRLFPEEG